MSKVGDLMTTDVITVGPQTKIIEATKTLLERRINGLPVVDEDNNLLGIICQSDIIAQQRQMPLPTIFTLFDSFIPLSSSAQLEREVQKMSATVVEEAMTSDPTTATPETDLEEVAEIMVKRNYHTIPVVQEGKLVGVIGKEDVLKTLLK
jgi:CBS domain-containing protein